MTLRKALFWTHLAVGVSAGLIILSMCFTGMLLAFQPQIVEFSQSGFQLIPSIQTAARHLSVELLLARTAEAFPETPPTTITLDSKSSSLVVIRLGQEGSIYLNPYTGAILGKESKVSQLLHKVEEWHRWFGNREVGKPITGAGAIAFLGLSLSGVYLWWPRAMSFKGAAFFKRGLQGKARDWNWHTVTGFWFSLYFILITTTGIVMSYTWANNLLYTLTGNKPPVFERRATPSAAAPKMKEERKPAKRPSFSGLNVLWEKAEQQVPGWETIMLRIPKAGDPASFFILDPASGRAHGRSQLVLDRTTGNIVKWEPYSGMNRGRRLRIWMTPLHTGRAWGIGGQFINFIAAMGGLLLIWTGFALAFRRFFGKRAAT